MSRTSGIPRIELPSLTGNAARVSAAPSRRKEGEQVAARRRPVGRRFSSPESGMVRGMIIDIVV